MDPPGKSPPPLRGERPSRDPPAAGTGESGAPGVIGAGFSLPPRSRRRPVPGRRSARAPRSSTEPGRCAVGALEALPPSVNVASIKVRLKYGARTVLGPIRRIWAAPQHRLPPTSAGTPHRAAALGVLRSPPTSASRMVILTQGSDRHGTDDAAGRRAITHRRARIVLTSIPVSRRFYTSPPTIVKCETLMPIDRRSTAALRRPRSIARHLLLEPRCPRRTGADPSHDAAERSPLPLAGSPAPPDEGEGTLGTAVNIRS